MTYAITIAKLPAFPSIGENASFIIVGFLFVVIMLGLLAAATSLIGSFFKRMTPKPAETKPKAAPASAAPAAKAAAVADPEENPHLIPLIAAAVHTAVGGQPHRIVGIRASVAGWAEEGRRQIFSSHRVR